MNNWNFFFFIFVSLFSKNCGEKKKKERKIFTSFLWSNNDDCYVITSAICILTTQALFSFFTFFFSCDNLIKSLYCDVHGFRCLSFSSCVQLKINENWNKEKEKKERNFKSNHHWVTLRISRFLQSVLSRSNGCYP